MCATLHATRPRRPDSSHKLWKKMCASAALMTQVFDSTHNCYSSLLFRHAELVHRPGRRKRLPMPADGCVRYSPVRDAGQRGRHRRFKTTFGPDRGQVHPARHRPRMPGPRVRELIPGHALFFTNFVEKIVSKRSDRYQRC